MTDKEILTRLKLHSFRTINDSIKLQTQNVGAEEARVIVYEPGNMTKYTVMFQELSTNFAQVMMGCDGGTLIVFVDVPNRPTLLVPRHTGHISLNYFMEKTGISEGDAAPLLRLVRHHLGMSIENLE